MTIMKEGKPLKLLGSLKKRGCRITNRCNGIYEVRNLAYQYRAVRESGAKNDLFDKDSRHKHKSGYFCVHLNMQREIYRKNKQFKERLRNHGTITGSN